MSQLAVITFEDRESAGQACERLKSLEKAHGAEYISRMSPPSRRTPTARCMSITASTWIMVGGVAVGGLLGLMVGLVFFPVAGLAIGAVMGACAVLGHTLHQNIDKQLVTDVTRDLTENTSALFVLGSGNAAAIVGALEPYKGKIYQTTLDPDAEAQVQAALDKGKDGELAHRPTRARRGRGAERRPGRRPTPADVLVPDVREAPDELSHEGLARGRIEVHDLHAT